jgi:hypothetical protein
MATPGASGATGATSVVAARPGRLLWRLAEVVEVVPATPSTRSLVLGVPGGEAHKAGQRIDVRLTAEDGYQAQRSYPIASAPEDERLMLTVDRLEDGEVSLYLTVVVMAGDRLEFRGPIGVFSFEVTTAGYACGGCDRTGRLRRAKVYGVRDLGTIVRCPECDNALIRLVQDHERYLVDLRGTRYLATG